MQTHKLLFLTLFVALFGSRTSLAAKFNFKSFDGSNLVFLGDAELGASPDGTSRSGSLSMTRDDPFSHGRGLFINPVPFKPSNSSSSVPYPFETSFTFSIKPQKTNPIPGHGLAFIIVPEATHDVAGPAGFLGFLNRTNNGNPENHAFAVEFDVVQDKTLGDINDNHVGVDVNSVVSVASQKAGYWVRGAKREWSFQEVKLSSGDKYKAWIEYEKQRLTVTIAPENVKKPKRPLIDTNIDLSNVFLDNMYVGFSGAMGRGIERHEIWSWSFKNSAKKN